MQLRKLYAAVAAALATCPLAHAAVEEVPSTLRDQQSVAITIHNENLALVKDTRRVTLEAGPNRLALREVSGRMRPETAQLRSLSQPGALTLIEQNFDFDLLTPAKLLEKYVGRTVRVVTTHPTTGAESVETATVLAAGRVRAMAAPEAAASDMKQESLFEYHLYTLGRPTTIADNQTKQVALLSAGGVPVVKELVLQGSDYYYRSSFGNIGQKMKVGVFVQFENRESSRLGMPMPKGVVRVYKKDSSGNAQFVGEDAIDHTPKNQNVRLKLGEAFDVTADKKQTDFRRREPGNKASYVFESAYEILLRNAKKEPATVVVREPVPGDWTMLEESSRHAKVAAGTAEWRVAVPAEGSATLRYRVLVRY